MLFLIFVRLCFRGCRLSSGLCMEPCLSSLTGYHAFDFWLISMAEFPHVNLQVYDSTVGVSIVGALMIREPLQEKTKRPSGCKISGSNTGTETSKIQSIKTQTNILLFCVLTTWDCRRVCSKWVNIYPRHWLGDWCRIIMNWIFDTHEMDSRVNYRIFVRTCLARDM